MNQNEFFFKIVIVGAPSVGKTALLERYVEGKFSEGYKATMLSFLIFLFVVLIFLISNKKQIKPF